MILTLKTPLGKLIDKLLKGGSNGIIGEEVLSLC